MKKILLLLVFILKINIFTIAQSPQYYVYLPNNNNQIIGPYAMPTNAIADDFGPRDLSDGFHAGVDFNCWSKAGSDQKWYPAVSPEVGLIADFDRLTHGQTKYKYGLVNVVDGEGNDSHTLLFGHVFDDNKLFYDEFNHSIILKRCESPNQNKWGLFLEFNDINGNVKRYVYGQVPGKTLKVNNNFYFTTTVINTNDPFIPIGDSGGNYPVHLHLNTLPYNTDVSSDAINGDPCQFLDIDVPTYKIKTWSELNDSKIDLKYPGNTPTKIAARIQMEGEPLNVKRYDHLMDCDKVELEIKSVWSSDYERIRGDKMTAIVSEGGRLGESVINHTFPPNKTNWNSQGVNSNAYNGAETGDNAKNPWDDYYFTDFKTRIHKDDKLNNASLYSDTPRNVRYNDGRYEFRVKATATNNSYNIGSESILTIDNFLPNIKEIRVYFNQDLVRKLTRKSFEGTSEIDDGFIQNAWEVFEFYQFDIKGDLRLEVTTSEPMLSVRMKKINDNYFKLMIPLSTNPYEWYFNYPNKEISVDECFNWFFDGLDNNFNSLLDVYDLTDDNGSKAAYIPTRRANHGNASDWNNYPDELDYDQVKFCFTECTDGSGGAIRNRDSGCDELNNIEVDVQDISCLEDGYIEISGLTDSLDYYITWTNEAGESVSEDSKFITSIPGVYCYTVSFENCCLVSDCIELNEKVFSNNDLTYTWDKGSAPNKKTLKIAMDNIPDVYGYYIYYAFIDQSTGDKLCEGRIGDGNIHSADCSNLIIGNEYCVEIHNDGGYCYQDCFTVEGNSCESNFFEITGEVSNPNCTDPNSGSITIDVEATSSSGCSNYSYKWDNDATTKDIDGLSTGTYCVKVKFTNAACQDCYTVKCFDVESYGNSPIIVDAVTSSICAEIYDEDAGQYIIKWYGTVDMKINGGSGNYSFTWSLNPTGQSNNGGDYRFTFDEEGPYCVTITDECGNSFEDCFDDNPSVVEGDLDMEVISSPCLTDSDYGTDFYDDYTYTNPEIVLVDVVTLILGGGYPSIIAYNQEIDFSLLGVENGTATYSIIVDNLFEMGEFSLPYIDLGLPNNVSNTIKDTKIADIDQLKLSAYPNPFSNELYITIDSRLESEGLLEVYNLNGQKVWSKNIHIVKGSNSKVVLDVSTQVSGVYTIVLKSKSEIISRKIIKIK